jgi:hypothetical protein
LTGVHDAGKGIPCRRFYPGKRIHAGDKEGFNRPGVPELPQRMGSSYPGIGSYITEQGDQGLEWQQSCVGVILQGQTGFLPGFVEQVFTHTRRR